MSTVVNFFGERLKATLTDKSGLLEALAALGHPMGERQLARALKALGIREAESRPLPSPHRGRTKHYYYETAWAIAAAVRSGQSDERVSGQNNVEPYRAIWDEAQKDRDLAIKYSVVPGVGDREFAAQLLYAFGYGHGPEARWLDRVESDDKNIYRFSSYGRDFMDDVIRSYDKALGQLIAARREMRSVSERERSVRFANHFMSELAERVGTRVAAEEGIESGALAT